MADAWGGSWGAAWGSAWGGAGPPPQPSPYEIPHRGRGGIVSPAYARQADTSARQFDENRRKDQKALRRNVERAFRVAQGLPLDDEEAPLPAEPEAVRHIAEVALAQLELRGFLASLATVERLVEAMLQEIARQREQRMEEEAAVWLLLNVI